MSKASFSFKINNFAISQLNKNIMQSMDEMATAIEDKAITKAPVMTGNLAGSIRIDNSQRRTGTIFIKAGGSVGTYNVPYAIVREFKNNRHPSTTHYMSRSFNEVTKDYSKYFEGITK